MSTMNLLLIFGLPLAGYLCFLLWLARKPKKGWNKSPPRSGGVAEPPESGQKDASTSGQALKVQREIAALRRVSSNQGSVGGPAVTSGRPGVFNLPARWEIQYVDAYGGTSNRVIQIQHLDLRMMEIEAYCEMRRAVRTFKVRNIKTATDARTGLRVDVRGYVESVRAGRRARR